MPVLDFTKFPLDVRQHVLKVQSEKKIEKGIAQYSQFLTICNIIREHEILREKQKK